MRQLIREQPLETMVFEHAGEKLTVPTAAEILRIKAVLILKRNATRDYLDFVALAAAFGWRGARVSNPTELEQALKDCLEHDGPYLLDVVVCAQEHCFPMIASGAGHHEIMLDENRLYKNPPVTA